MRPELRKQFNRARVRDLCRCEFLLRKEEISALECGPLHTVLKICCSSFAMNFVEWLTRLPLIGPPVIAVV